MKNKIRYLKFIAVFAIAVIVIVVISRIFLLKHDTSRDISSTDSTSSTYALYDTIKNGFARNLYSINRQIESEGKMLNGLKDSIWTYYTVDGLIKEQFNFEKNIKNGKFIKYYENGKVIKEKGFYINGVINGIVDEYFDNGNLRDRFVYKNGVKEGKYEGYDYIESNNRQYINTKGYYKNDKQDGEWKYYAYYYDISNNRTGNKLILTAIENYKEGALHGKWIEFDPQYGFKLIETEYKNGLEDGIRKNYCPTGQDARKLWYIDEYSKGNVVKKHPYECGCY